MDILKKLKDSTDFINPDLGEYIESFIKPQADDLENGGSIDPDSIKEAGRRGYLGCVFDKRYGGLEWSCLTYGALLKEIAKISPSFTGIFNVNTMVAKAIEKWGTEKQKADFLPQLGRGEKIAAFALTEPEAGSDVNGITTKIEEKGDHYLINGTKRWITCGEIADLYLVFGKCDSGPTAILVDRNTEGLNVIPIRKMVGFRGANLAVLEFRDCQVPAENIIAKPKFAFTHIAPFSLDYGRLAVAFTALGILEGCLESSSLYLFKRKVADKRLLQYGQIKEMITRMGVDYEAAALLCVNAALCKDSKASDSMDKMLMAKYFTTEACSRHAEKALQIHGAAGCHEDNVLARYYRDAKILRIIEGSDQVCELLLSHSIVQKNRRLKKRA